MNSQIVTVIVPIFNAGKTLHRCLKSITEQTYSNLEIILIDDGSTDESAAICQSLQRLDNRITLIRQQNTGPAGARNRGIKDATGNFIQFVDADDFIERQITEKLVKYIKKNDLVICGYQNNSHVIKPHIEGSYSKTDTVKHFGQLYKNTIIQSPCNKLYKTHIIRNNQLSFWENYVFGEDLRFNLAYLTLCERVFFTEKPLYIYEQNKQSITNSYIDNLLEQQLTIHDDVYQFLNKNNGNTVQNISDVRETFINSIIHTATNIIHPNSPYTKAEQKQQLKELINNETVQKDLPYFTHSLQAQLFKHLIKQKAVTGTLIFLRLKELLRKNGPTIFNILKRTISKEGYR